MQFEMNPFDFTSVFEATAMSPVKILEKYVPFTSMTPGQISRLTNFRLKMTTSNRTYVAVDINEQGDWIVLPPRLNALVTDQRSINILNNMNYWVKFHGFSSNTPILEFRKMPYSQIYFYMKEFRDLGKPKQHQSDYNDDLEEE
jgi:hypothetical protein